MLCGTICFSLKVLNGGSDATLHAGKEALVSEGSPLGGPQLGLEAAEGDGGALCQMSRGLTMVKPESLLLLLLSSSGLELGLLEEAEAGPIRGSENTSGKRARLSPFPDVLLRVRSGWAWLERGALALPPPSSLETRMKSSELPSSACPGTSEEACGAQSGAQG